MRQKKRILFVDDEPDISKLVIFRLKKEGYEVLAAKNGSEALDLARNKPDLILLDLLLPDIDGYEVCRRIKADSTLREIPIIFFTVKDSIADKIKGLKAGIHDYITKPIDHEELSARIAAALRINSHYKKIALTDELTGFYNYNFFVQEFSHNFDLAKRYGRVFSLMLIDIDNFKKINDNYGHLCGNLALKKIAQKLRGSLRKADIIARFGGDEFVIIFPETDFRQEAEVFQRLKNTFGKIGFKYRGREIEVNLSFGLAAYSKGITSKEALFNIADRNMYENKKEKERIR